MKHFFLWCGTSLLLSSAYGYAQSPCLEKIPSQFKIINKEDLVTTYSDGKTILAFKCIGGGSFEKVKEEISKVVKVDGLGSNGFHYEINNSGVNTRSFVIKTTKGFLFQASFVAGSKEDISIGRLRSIVEGIISF